MTILEKITALRKVGWSVEKKGSGWVVHHEKRNADNPLYLAIYGIKNITHIYTDREVSKLYKTEFVKPKKWKAIAKQYTKERDRAAKRDLIIAEKFDDIPLDRPIKIEDPWDHD